MMKFLMLLKRDVKLFFKDKGMFFTSLITPLILLVLYATFLADVYRDSFASAMPAGLSIPDDLIDATVGGQLLSSLLAVSCVTVAFCSNLLMVQDKVNGTRNDLTVSPVKRSTVALAYFFGTEFATLIVNYVALGIGFIYLGKMGWYLSGKDVLSIILDVFLLTLFGTLLSSCVNVWLSTSGQASAVGTIIVQDMVLYVVPICLSLIFRKVCRRLCHSFLELMEQALSGIIVLEVCMKRWAVRDSLLMW